jgi:hypothetical protein
LQEELSQTHKEVAEQLEADGALAAARRHFVEAGCWRAAANMYCRHGRWRAALRLGRKHGTEAEVAEVRGAATETNK